MGMGGGGGGMPGEPHPRRERMLIYRHGFDDEDDGWHGQVIKSNGSQRAPTPIQAL